MIFSNEQSDGQYKKTACNDKLRKLNPEFKFTSMQEGLKAVSGLIGMRGRSGKVDEEMSLDVHGREFR